MKSFIRGLFYIAVLVSLILPIVISQVSATTTIPKIEPYVNDFAGMLSPQEELQLNLLADQIENRTTFEIAIVTVTGTGGQDRLEFANMIGDQNGVGKKDADNGIVVLWSVGDDVGGAIATGRGSGSFVTDSTTGRIGREARPYFDKGENANGFIYILNELDKVIVAHQNQSSVIPSTTDQSGDTDFPFYIIVFIISSFFFIIIIKLFSSYDDSSDDELEEGDPGYYRQQVYKRNKKWYNGKGRSYLTAAAAAAALATIYESSSDDSDDESSGSSSSYSGSGSTGGSFSGGSFGGGGSHF